MDMSVSFVRPPRNKYAEDIVTLLTLILRLSDRYRILVISGALVQLFGSTFNIGVCIYSQGDVGEVGQNLCRGTSYGRIGR